MTIFRLDLDPVRQALEATVRYPGKRLHVRAIIRDGRRAFVGSQSLRKLELEGRREVGLLFQDRRVVKQMLEVFEEDWSHTDLGRRNAKRRE